MNMNIIIREENLGLQGMQDMTASPGDNVAQNGAGSLERNRIEAETTVETKVFANCRICHDEDELKNLETPCSCSGSIKYAHRRCVQRWCIQKRDTICEICRQSYGDGYNARPRFNGLQADMSEQSQLFEQRLEEQMEAWTVRSVELMEAWRVEQTEAWRVRFEERMEARRIRDEERMEARRVRNEERIEAWRVRIEEQMEAWRVGEMEAWRRRSQERLEGGSELRTGGPSGQRMEGGSEARNGDSSEAF